MLPAAGDADQIVGPAAKLFPDVVDPQINATGLADDPRQCVSADRSLAAKIVASTRFIHSRQRASCGR